MRSEMLLVELKSGAAFLVVVVAQLVKLLRQHRCTTIEYSCAQDNRVSVCLDKKASTFDKIRSKLQLTYLGVRVLSAYPREDFLPIRPCEMRAHLQTTRTLRMTRFGRLA